MITVTGSGATRYASLFSENTDATQYELHIDREAVLQCETNMLVKIITDAIDVGGFDTLYLDGFNSVAMLTKKTKDGLPTYTIMPPPFLKQRLVSSAQVIKHNKRGGNRQIMVVAFVFFLIVLVGAVAYNARTRRQRRQ